MVHLWLRAEERQNEQRTGLMPEGAAALIAQGFRVTVEESAARIVPIEAYAEAGCETAPEGAWRDAPDDAIIFGLKELDEDGPALRHRHIMFGHAYKGQAAGARLLDRFREGGGTLYDLEYLTDEAGRRVAAFGHWAGYAGAAVALQGWAAQVMQDEDDPLAPYDSAEDMADDVRASLNATLAPRPRALIIGAKGRVGGGVKALCDEVGVACTEWDMAETAHGGPFPEVLAHELFFNCILAMPGVPVFVPEDAPRLPRKLTMIGDIACDPGSEFSPVRVYDRVTDWDEPILHLDAEPPLAVMAIDNLPALLPLESSADYAAQLLPSLARLDRIGQGEWARAKAEFDRHTG